MAAEVPLQQIVSTLADLRALNPSSGQYALMVGAANMSDGKGGFYRWDGSSTANEDSTYYNVVQATGVTTGRWVRIFQRARTTAGGATLVNNGGVKTLFYTGTTDANGQIVVPMTEEGTQTGTAIFAEIWSVTATPNTDAAGPSDAVQSYRMSRSADLKTTKYGFYKANAVTITLGLFLTPVASIGSGTQVLFRIEGV
jgi:hypothetical protein